MDTLQKCLASGEPELEKHLPPGKATDELLQPRPKDAVASRESKFVSSLTAS